MKITILATSLMLSMATISIAETPAATAPIKIEQAEKKLAVGAQLLDVRTKEEWDEGHLKGAKLVTVTEEGFLENPARFMQRIVAVRAAGFTVDDMEGGITAWKAAGKPVEK